jgi:hypothetical protein
MLVSKRAYDVVCENRDHWRAQYETMQRLYVEAIAKQHELMDAERQLMDEQRRLIRDGFHAPPPPPVMPDETSDALDPEIQQAILARAIDRDMRLEMELWARQQLAAGLAAGLVADKVWDGEEGGL